MLKALFIITTIVIAVVLANQPNEEHTHHKRQHVEHVGQPRRHLAEPSKHHHPLEQNKEQVNHGRVKVPIAPHHSKAHRINKGHKSQKSSKASRSHHPHQPKSAHHKKQSHKVHGHGRKHH